ncbi:MAG: hypothetical protein K2O79_06520 [Muribaculaceae bacterium]|nr:hypothetical protein [Muribaculaceae bacterium]
MLNINKILLKLLSDRLGRSATRLELEPRIKAIGLTLPELTDIEKKSIVDLWSRLKPERIDFDYWRFYKILRGRVVSPYFVPDNIYWSRIIRTLNPASLTRAYINKSLYPIIFKGIRQPEILVNVINGIYYNGKMDRITADTAVDILSRFDDDIIIKPTVATSGGRGVSKIDSDAGVDEIKKILSKYGSNYICQGIVRQSASTAVFNPTSLNTFRVNTVNINGKTTCECLMMRHGLNGSVVDNFAVGGVVCGLTTDGKFNGNNFNTELKQLSQLHNGTPYSSLSVAGISDVVDYAIDSHQRYMPHIGHAAWDFAINENGQPIMIEVNLMLPGILMEQLTSSGSIFGNRTEEVVEYAARLNSTLSWTEFVGGWQ